MVVGRFPAVRIAFSGSHRVGKTTLIESVAERLPGHGTVDEPYYLLEEEGYEFAEEPSLEDFEAQLARSLAALDDAGPDVLFDRCPVDILAYLLVHRDASAFDLDARLEQIRDAVQTLDLIVFVPIEDSVRVGPTTLEEAAHRRAVHDRLCDLLLDRELGVDVEVVTVRGDVQARTEQVVERATRRAPR